MSWFAAISDNTVPSHCRDLELQRSSSWSFELCGSALLPTQTLCCHMEFWHLFSPFISYPLWEVLWYTSHSLWEDHVYRLEPTLKPITVHYSCHKNAFFHIMHQEYLVKLRMFLHRVQKEGTSMHPAPQARAWAHPAALR